MKPAREQDIRKLIESIYELMGTDELWPRVLGQYAELTSATHATVGLLSLQQKKGVALEYVYGMSASDQYFYNLHYAAHDPFVVRVQPSRSGQIMASHMACPDRVLETTEVYNDFLRPRRLHYGMAGAIWVEEDRVAAIGCLRDRHLGECQQELTVLRRLMPHLQRAARIHFELSERRHTATTLMDILDILPNGLFVLEGSSRVMVANAKAREIVAGGDGLFVGREGLTTARSNESHELHSKIRLAALARGGTDDSDNGCMLVSRPSGRQPYRVFVCPVPTNGPLNPHPRASVLVFVTDPELKPDLQIRTVKTLFGLTPAETKFLDVLISLGTLELAAEAIGISRNTAKTQLQQIFHKTGARRQTELIRLVYTMPVAGDLSR